MTILVTGGAGFIGSNFVLHWLALRDEPVVNLDSLSYSGNLNNLAPLRGDGRYSFVKGSIGDRNLVAQLLADNNVRAIVNFAAESHVDRSILDPGPFFETNVMGTLGLLEATRQYGSSLGDRKTLRLIHVSTDEVFGSLKPTDPAFSETTPYRPNSPYAASKAGSDHLVRAYHETFGLSTIISNCSNNYGPLQFPEKLIPLMIINAISGKALPVYGNGLQIRDWLHVKDHCSALMRLLDEGMPGQTYNIGGNNQKTNLEVVALICELLDKARPRSDGTPYAAQITHINDRPGHDTRYAIDTTKIFGELGWAPATNFESGLEETVDWYLSNSDWVENVTSGAYRDWIKKHYQ